MRQRAVKLNVVFGAICTSLVARAARETCMGAGEFTGADRTDDRNLTGKTEGRSHLSQGTCMTCARKPHNLQTGLLAWQLRAAADAADDQVREGHRNVERTLLRHFHACGADRGLRH